MAPSMLDVPAMDCLIPALVSVGVFHPPERHYGVKNQVSTSWSTSYTRLADLRLLFEMQLLPVKVCPGLCFM